MPDISIKQKLQEIVAAQEAQSVTHPLSEKLRALADLLDIVAAAGMGDEVAPIDNNQTLEISQAAYNYCMEIPQGREALQILESLGIHITQYDAFGYVSDLDLIAE